MLQDPLRRQLYEYVVAQDHDVSRNEAAEGAGIGRTLAAFHLDKLVDARLLVTESRRLTGRSGPGAGRPAKLYRRSGAEHHVSVPARDYRTAADLLAEVADGARLDVELRAAATREGRAARAVAGPFEDLDAVRAVLSARGYEPRTDDAVLRLVNCPFHVLALRICQLQQVVDHVQAAPVVRQIVVRGNRTSGSSPGTRIASASCSP